MTRRAGAVVLTGADPRGSATTPAGSDRRPAMTRRAGDGDRRGPPRVGHGAGRVSFTRPTPRRPALSDSILIGEGTEGQGEHCLHVSAKNFSKSKIYSEKLKTANNSTCLEKFKFKENLNKIFIEGWIFYKVRSKLHCPQSAFGDVLRP